MKTHLSRILPVWQACQILGIDRVHRIVELLIKLKTQQPSQSSATSSPTTPPPSAAKIGAPQEDDVDMLVEALCYRGHIERPVHLGGQKSGLTAQPPLPPKIALAWKQWTTSRFLILDKNTFLRFWVPLVVQPHAGPQGHMGLFDCWVYAIQSHSFSTGPGGSPGTAQGGILIPDILILLAICKWYHDWRYITPPTSRNNGDKKNNPQMNGESDGNYDEEEYDDIDVQNDQLKTQEKVIWTMALLSYRIYDSYQKKGVVARDTVHRFLTDVYGEDSYKEPASKALLDIMFAPPTMTQSDEIGGIMEVSLNAPLDDGDYDEQPRRQQTSTTPTPAQMLHATVTELDWCRRVLDTIPKTYPLNKQITTKDNNSKKPYILFDWMATLAVNFIPPSSIPISIQSYLETMNTRKKSLCELYALEDHRLYEVKRRFHSLVQSGSPSVVEGDPINAASEEYSAGHSNTTAASPPSSSNNSSNSNNNAPKQVITQAAFVNAVSQPNDEMGQGGFLSPHLAKLVFQAGVVCSGDAAHSSNAYAPHTYHMLENISVGGEVASGSAHSNDNTAVAVSSKLHWNLYHVLRFGCLAVRGRAVTPAKPDTPLLRFLFELFQTTLVTTSASGSGSSVGKKQQLNPYARPKKNLLTREEVRQMIILLVEFADFRTKADNSVSPEVVDPDTSQDEPPSLFYETSNEDDYENSEKKEEGKGGEKEEQVWVDIQAASFLNLMPVKPKKERLAQKKVSDDKTFTMIPLEDLVEAVFADAKKNTTKTTAAKSTQDPLEQGDPLGQADISNNGDEKDVDDDLTFEEFCLWHISGGPKPTRLAQLMTELRLIAAVLFGVPPTDATMELRLIGEIESRHKERYTQTDVSRRGPRGTIWYLIDAGWLQKWAAIVRKASKMSSEVSSPASTPRVRDSVRDAISEIGPINNAGLLAEDGTLSLRPDVRWKHDYEILPPLAWSALQAWYDGGPPIYRSVVRYITTNAPSPHSYQATSNGPRLPTENELELYPFFVTVYLCDASSGGEARPFQQNYQVSRVSPVGMMLLQLCKELEVQPRMARLWVMESDPQQQLQQLQLQQRPSSTSVTSSSTSSHNTSSGNLASATSSDDWILNLDQNIIEQRKRRAAGNTGGGGPLTIMLELKDKETKLWPRGMDGKEWNFRGKKGSGATGSAVRLESDLGDGVVGLYNMGNTCYLNSSVQCLSHTPIFREYFTSKAYLRDINSTNPLGHEGRLAQVSAVLFNSIWKKFGGQQSHQPKRVNAPGSYALVTAPSLTPKTFKESIGKFNEHFQGNEQHDAQELLAFLLGGLSEDLNRIVDKPYIEAPDSDGRPDRELADIWWSNHLQRELSIIVALFTGQYKSLLTCRTCKYESARFEPFSFLQLPLPEDDNLSVTLILYPLKEGQDTMRYCVRVKSDGKLRDVLLALAKVLCADEADVWGNNSESDGNANDPESSSNKDGVSAAIAEDMHAERAKNLAVVDLREGYISKIAPNSWSLLDLQNKETAELPVLHVYDLEPLSKKFPGENGNTDESVDDEDEEDCKPMYGFLALAQRRSEVVSPDYLHPFAHRVFGTPLLLRIQHMEKITGKMMYDLVAKRLRNFVPKAAVRFLYPSVDDKSSDSSDGDNLKDRSDSSAEKKDTGRDRLSNSNKTTTDMEEVAAGPIPRYGFRLRLTSRDGRRCLTCPWFECCIGCFIPDDDAPVAVIDGDSIVVDWHVAVDLATSGFGTRANPSDPISNMPAPARPKTFSVTIKNHTTCASGLKRPGSGGTITLEDCLDAFAKEERIPEAYCSMCKDFRVQTKRMSLWRLPPVVIIHLKRFQFTQTMRRKLRDLVIFPVEGLDLSRIMARDPADQKEMSGSSESLESNGIKDDGRAEMLYDLYGVVHHQGALSGGHYVASLKSEIDGQWRLFNDAQIYEIHARDVVDSSAYILFYIRRDAAKGHLEDFWDTRGEGEGMSEEDLEKMVKGRSDRCVIS